MSTTGLTRASPVPAPSLSPAWSPNAARSLTPFSTPAGIYWRRASVKKRPIVTRLLNSSPIFDRTAARSPLPLARAPSRSSPPTRRRPTCAGYQLNASRPTRPGSQVRRDPFNSSSPSTRIYLCAEGANHRRLTYDGTYTTRAWSPRGPDRRHSRRDGRFHNPITTSSPGHPVLTPLRARAIADVLADAARCLHLEARRQQADLHMTCTHTRRSRRREPISPTGREQLRINRKTASWRN